ncbi:MAG: hypothetical protein H0V19_01765 [Euzebyales bacterium]|nr:hypothetical protein [Euzebyales bacterium]
MAPSSLLLDTNLLVYAAMPAMEEHGAARTWLRARYEDASELVGVSWPTLYAFVRLASSRRIMSDDASPLDDAWRAAMAFVEQDNARLIEAGPGHALDRSQTDRHARPHLERRARRATGGPGNRARSDPVHPRPRVREVRPAGMDRSPRTGSVGLALHNANHVALVERPMIALTPRHAKVRASGG